MVNFQPEPDEVNEFVYVEMLDTMALSRSDVKEYTEFFATGIKNETLISRTNLKLGKVSENIKYEYFFDKKPKLQKDKGKHNNDAKEEEKPIQTLSRKRLFCTAPIMAYIFVFDYNDRKSLESVDYLALEIKALEGNKNVPIDYKTVIVFFGNKYPYLIEGDLIGYDIYKHDENAQYILSTLKKHFSSNEEETKKHLIFTDAKSNINVDKAFRGFCKSQNCGG